MTSTDAAGSVLIEVEKRPTLAQAARAFFTRTYSTEILSSYQGPFDPSDIEIDRNFAALPVGPGTGRAHAPEAPCAAPLPLESFRPDNSERFLIRGFLKRPDALERLARDQPDAAPIFHSDPPIVGLLAPPQPTCGASSYMGDARAVQAKLGTATLMSHGLDGDGVALAIVDTGIFSPRITQLLGDMKPSGRTLNTDPGNSWKERVVTEPFFHRLGHGTMCAYDALLAAPQATLLDYALLLARKDGDPRLPATIAAALRAYSHLLHFWRARPYRALVVSNSWGTFHPSEDPYPPTSSCRYIDNPDHIFHVLVRRLAAAGADILFAGNNCGGCCPSATCLSQTSGMIMGANSYAEVLTIGGCDISDKLVGYSSRGPSIAGMSREKPDLVAYTHFLGSKTQRIYRPDAGVSAACAVAAGCVAALRTKLSPDIVAPSELFAMLRSTARNPAGPGWDRGYGYGIIDPAAAARELLPDEPWA
jgi:hypothetical protein